jgi:uncharacterized delta-60 repeat protein
VVAGFVSKGTNNNDFAVVRYSSDGSLDNAFGTNGIVITDFSGRNDVIYALAIQPNDKKIVVAGFNSYRGDATVPIFVDVYQDKAVIFGEHLTAVDFALARYDESGRLDEGFGDGGKVTTLIGDNASVARAIALQGDGKIVVAGYADNDGKANFALARYNSDGSPDNNFSVDGKVITSVAQGKDNGAMSVAIQSDGKILAAGNVENDSGGSDFSLARYNAGGSLDSGFAGDGTVITPVAAKGSAVAYAVTTQEDGKILAVGVASNGNDDDFTMVRYRANGSLDNSFGLGGRVITPVRSLADVAFSVAIQPAPDNKIIMAGRSLRPTGVLYDFALVRYWP